MFNPEVAEIRFGTGLSPRIAPPQSVEAMLDGVVRPDQMARDFSIESFDDFRHRFVAFQKARRSERKATNDEDRAAATLAKKRANTSARKAYAGMIRDTLLRRTQTTTGFRERLAYFWADHFTARGKSNIVRFGTSPYIEEAIRPHIAGRFEDLLIASVTHPLMLHYLDQAQSVGPNSKLGKRRARGLNENLAREVLELHTLGVDGPYSQDDVRQLAELFAGMSLDQTGAFKFKPAHVEPGVERVLGESYGRRGNLNDVHAALRDLARHPATARHIATKLAQHFTSDTTETELVDKLTAAYLESDGQLLNVYVALLDHPASWQPEMRNIKRPIDYIATALRALDVGAGSFARSNQKQLLNLIVTPMQIMGQPWQAPNGPDGWPEDDSFWLTPQFMAARLAWALSAPQALLRVLPDPREFAQTALGQNAPAEVAFAASAAENRWEGIALVLTSPAFQKF
ncbi:MAG: DUF1800 domain-containing protein [Cognatishimia sp.]|nr:DUF1800 domain-containing protein [Cognatishimia sp.]